MEIISAQEVIERLPMARCIDLMADTQAALSAGDIRIPLRQQVPASDRGTLLLMPGSHPGLRIAGIKMLTVYPDNPIQDQPLPAIQGYIALFNADNGTPLAMIEAASVTAIRTAAASAMATNLLAATNARSLTILGAGVQASSHIDAICEVRDINLVRVWARDREKLEAFVRSHQRSDVQVIAEPEIDRALQQADIVCAVTGAKAPIIRRDALLPGCHINLVGAHSPDCREADTATLRSARVFTEITEFALQEAGDLLLAMQDGGFQAVDIAGEIGDVVLGRVRGRESAEQITAYKSLGNVAQDLAAASHVFNQLLQQR